MRKVSTKNDIYYYNQILIGKYENLENLNEENYDITEILKGNKTKYFYPGIAFQVNN